uniref:ATP synthase subunit a n=1 Tax=Kisaura zhejiangensis (nom. nud.) TaxID=2904921 RepID=A0A9E8RTT8_9NEOP|nr:ATP synthase F0 subunit 6 [Kisaura zhejiangensis (nom. nud.)]UZZ44069.1 ATP synthase F0 subunit 6 [Kisaura zhejiangensis (nom. nud.)]
MMNNLFSIFDPTSMMNIPLNWISSFMIILFIPLYYWLIPSSYMFIIHNMLITIHKEFKNLLSIQSYKGSTLMFISLFLMILFNNLMGMFPYIFTSSSHMSMNLSLSLPLWISFMLFGWIMNYQHMFTHLIPQGTPPILMPFMVLIETISNIIRPMTLSIRLTANMIAGHLLLTLLSQSMQSLNLIMLMIMLIIQVLLLTLEFSVAFIQAYVFSILSTLYSKETY